MRIWSLHPQYLDTKGIVALWRETLLAQNVLLGNTKGYKNHPQLDRFKAHTSPIEAVGTYLLGVYDEAVSRGYNFDRSKITSVNPDINKIPVTTGQVQYEFLHLKRKLEIRDINKHSKISAIAVPKLHPIFIAVDGDIEVWERF